MQSGSSACVQDMAGATFERRSFDWRKLGRLPEKITDWQRSFLAVIPANQQFCVGITLKVG
jgi:hypothetical protein